jgi:inner membrane protein
MAGLFAQIEYWHWWSLGIALLVLEAFAPGAIFLWMGIAAGVVGLVLLVAPAIAWQAQLIAFAVLSVVAVVGWRLFQRGRGARREASTLNRRGEQYVGRRFTLDQPIVNGDGKLRIDDTMWRVAGEDMAAGTTVRVVGADGVILKVQRA